MSIEYASTDLRAVIINQTTASFMKRNLISVFLLATAVLIGISGFSQNKIIKGHVTDAAGVPVAGASGEGTLIAGNYMQPFKPGEIYLLGANQPHIFKSDPIYFDKRRRKEVHALTFFFNPASFFRAILELPETKTIKKFVDKTIYGLQAPATEQKRLSAEMLIVKNCTAGFRLAAFIRLLQTMADIKNWKTLASISSGYSFSDTEGLRMNEVYQFTMSHYSENIKLGQVADVAYLTPQAFCRYFKKHTRKTYITFLSEIRINEACKKIIAGNFDSISSVAYDTGFSSAVSFNRVFKKFTGKSPRQYLKEYTQKVD